MNLEVQHVSSPEKMVITVCVGSSCHLKGAYEIVRFLKESIRSSGLEQRVVLRGSFCMERCGEGVTVKIGEEVNSVASVSEMEKIFRERVASPLVTKEIK